MKVFTVTLPLELGDSDGHPFQEFGDADGHRFHGNQYVHVTSDEEDKETAENLKKLGVTKIDNTMLRVWETYPGSEAIRIASEDILGLAHPTDHGSWSSLGGYETNMGLNNLIGGMRDDDENEWSPEQYARDMLKALASDKGDVVPPGERGDTRIEQFRGLGYTAGTSEDAKYKIENLAEGDTLDLGLIAVGNSPETAHAFGEDATLVFEPGMRVLMGNDPAFEHITAGRFEVTGTEEVENSAAEDGTENIIRLRQVSVFDPDTLAEVASAEVGVLPASEADVDHDLFSLFAKPKPVTASMALEFGDEEGHNFHGNQWTQVGSESATAAHDGPGPGQHLRPVTQTATGFHVKAKDGTTINMEIGSGVTNKPTKKQAQRLLSTSADLYDKFGVNLLLQIVGPEEMARLTGISPATNVLACGGDGTIALLEGSASVTGNTSNVVGLDHGSIYKVGTDRYTLTHEYGHLYDQARSSASLKTAMFGTAMSSSGHAGLSKYGQSNPTEGYAEAFADHAFGGKQPSTAAYAKAFGWP